MKKIFLLVLIIQGTSAFTQGWRELGADSNESNPNDGMIASICMDSFGNVYAVGNFVNADGKVYVAKWNGITWSELGKDSNPFSTGSSITAICSDASGNVYTIGTYLNSKKEGFVAKWDGKKWMELGSLKNSNWGFKPDDLCIDEAGHVYAIVGHYDYRKVTAKYYVVKWDGKKWIRLGAGRGSFQFISKICTDISGNIYAGGNLNRSNKKAEVVKWNGKKWIELLGDSNHLNSKHGLSALCTDANGNIYAAAEFVSDKEENYVAKWNGGSWIKLGNDVDLINGYIDCISVDSEGNVYAAGNLKKSNKKYYTTNYYVVKWNGTHWTELGEVDSLVFNAKIKSVCTDSKGNIYVAGCFVNSKEKCFVAKYSR